MHNAATEAQLRAAIDASAPGDIVNLTSDIVVLAEIVIDSQLRIQGNGHRITVPVPAFDDSGLPNLDASLHRVFQIREHGDVHLDRLEIRGGNALATDGFGGAILVNFGKLRLSQSTISHSRSEGEGGALDNNQGEVYISDSRILRNAAGLLGFRGGGLVIRFGILHLDRVTVAENRTEAVDSNGGGVAVEGNSQVFINNSTFANNVTRQLGGGLWSDVPVFIANSTFTGNVSGGFPGGGAVHSSGNLINSLAAFNYFLANPSVAVGNDLHAPGGARYHMTLSRPFTAAIFENVDWYDRLYLQAPETDPRAVFTGSRSARMRDNQGFETGDARVEQPLLVDVRGALLVTPNPDSVLFKRDYIYQGAPVNLSGTAAGYHEAPTPVFGYIRVPEADGPDGWIGLIGSAAEAEAARVTIDQIGNPRPIGEDAFYVRGATNEAVSGYYQLRIPRSAGGRFVGGSIFGDSHAVGTPVNLTALPDDGQRFAGWACVEDCPSPLPPGTILSLANPFGLDMPAHHLTLSPVFEAADPGEFTVTYVGNRSTGGNVPASVRGSSTVLIAPAGDLVREGYRFAGWSTRPNGIAGTAFAPGQSHAGPGNLHLYAQWIHPTAAAVFADGFECSD
ncbi:MAG: InlB B-repeat-containing protein [Aquimonas sp.]|nr:InlB B-repeat-containing protein [Aquimonas sp.]